MKKILFTCLVAIILVTGCGKKKVKLEEIKTLSNNQELVSKLSKDATVSDMILLGKYYKLPAKLQDFFDNGWEFIGDIQDNPYETLLGMDLKANSYIDVTLVHDLKKIIVRVVNPTADSHPITKDTLVSSITVYQDGVNEADDFIIKSGVNLKTTITDADDVYSLLENYTSGERTVNLYREETNLIHIEPLSTDENTIEFIRVSEEVSQPDYMLSGMEVKGTSYDVKKTATFQLKRKCYMTGKTYPITEKGYKRLLSDLHKKEDIEALYVKGTVIDKAYASLSTDLFGFSSKDIYIMEDENGNKYAFYAKVSGEDFITGLNIGDIIELYSTAVELIDTKKDGYYPLLRGKIVIKNGVEIANIAEILY